MKLDFYDAIQVELEKIPQNDLTTIMGDINAKVVQDDKCGSSNMNENGEYLAEFCGNSNLVISGKIYPHKEIHKLTWVSSDGRDINQKDHIVVNGRWRRSLQDVGVRKTRCRCRQ